jgi:hypothetical protein
MRFGHLFRIFWAVFGVVAAAVLVLATAADGLIFALAYGSKVGSYGGQAGDRHHAWLVLAYILAAWAFVLLGMIWPAVRWRRRGMYAAPET